jgi:adenine-specific DNA-methyltransferase
MQNLYKTLETLLKSDERFVSQDGKDLLLKNFIQQKASEMDAGLIKLLLSDESLKKHFFSEIEQMLIFDKAKFIDFIYNKEFLPDSYTSFANKIGLMDDKQFMKEQRDVVLARPYKDCILEWWQDKEDAKRNEVFHNMTLAPDQITRLLKPKVLTNREHYSTDGEKQLTDSDVKDLDFEKENLIIKGNNLLVLYSLKERFTGKVKLIYIDPPYNTGNDEFKYNDSFNHSTWLTFMKNRLEIAKELLKNDWAIFVHCDDNEQAYLKILMDEVFWQNNLNSIITVKVSSESWVKVNANKPVRVKEYIMIYTKNSEWTYKKQYTISNKYDANYSYYVENPNDEPNKRSICNIKEKYLQINKKDPSEKDLSKFQIENKNNIFSVRDISSSLKKLFWDNKDQFIIKENESKKTILRKNWEVVFFAKKVNYVDWKEYATKYLSDIRTDIKWDWIANEWWVTLKWWKKPEALIKRIVQMWSEKWDIVLDYHWWSWTTGAVAHKMWRQRILVEQMDYIKDLPQQRLKNVIDWDTSWISKVVDRKWWGSFVYTELKTRNQTILDRINASNDNKELISIRNEMREWGFLSVKVDLKNFDEYFDEFTGLSIEDKKAFLIESLDKNMLYVPLGEIDDAKYNISDDDKALTNAFYNRTEK